MDNYKNFNVIFSDQHSATAISSVVQLYVGYMSDSAAAKEILSRCKEFAGDEYSGGYTRFVKVGERIEQIYAPSTTETKSWWIRAKCTPIELATTDGVWAVKDESVIEIFHNNTIAAFLRVLQTRLIHQCATAALESKLTFNSTILIRHHLISIQYKHDNIEWKTVKPDDVRWIWDQFKQKMSEVINNKIIDQEVHSFLKCEAQYADQQYLGQIDDSQNIIMIEL